MPPAEQEAYGCVIGCDYPAPLVDRADFEAALSGLEVSWGQEIAALRAEIARQHGIAAHTSHFATCPQAGYHRRRNPQVSPPPGGNHG